MFWAVARSAGSIVFFDLDPGAGAPGFMLSPAPRAYNLRRGAGFMLSPSPRAY